MKFGLQYHYQQGKVQINHNRFLDYTKDAEDNLIIDPEQAEIVKRIYREYLEGLNIDKIAAELERDGILTGAGGKWWHISTINKILRNEKYIGDVLLQKTYTTDFAIACVMFSQNLGFTYARPSAGRKNDKKKSTLIHKSYAVSFGCDSLLDCFLYTVINRQPFYQLPLLHGGYW